MGKLFTLSPVSVFPQIHFGFLVVVMVTPGTLSHDKLSRLDDSGWGESCMEWSVSKDPRSPQRQNRSRTPQREKGAQKSTSPSFKCHGLEMRAVLANVIFTHGFYKRGFFQRALTLSGLTSSKRKRAIHGQKCSFQPHCDIPTFYWDISEKRFCIWAVSLNLKTKTHHWIDSNSYENITMCPKGRWEPRKVFPCRILYHIPRGCFAHQKLGYYLVQNFTRYYKLTRTKCISNAESVMPSKFRSVCCPFWPRWYFVKNSKSPTADPWRFNPSSGAFCTVKIFGNP